MDSDLRPSSIRASARMSLAGRWNTGAAAMLIFLLLLAGCVRLHALSQGLGYGVAALGMPVLLAGCQWLFLNVSSGRVVRVGDMFAPFGLPRDYFRVLMAWVLILLIVALGALLFFIPAARSCPVPPARGSAGGTRSAPPALHSWRPPGTGQCPGPW